MEKDFESNEKSIKALIDYVEKYRNQERHIAAERLEEQLKLVQKSFIELVEKFALFKSASDFEPKRSKFEKTYSGIEKLLDSIKIKSYELKHLCDLVSEVNEIYEEINKLKQEVEKLDSIDDKLHKNCKNLSKKAEEKKQVLQRVIEVASKLDENMKEFEKLYQQQIKDIKEEQLLSSKQKLNDIKELVKFLEELIDEQSLLTLKETIEKYDNLISDFENKVKSHFLEDTQNQNNDLSKEDSESKVIKCETLNVVDEKPSVEHDLSVLITSQSTSSSSPSSLSSYNQTSLTPIKLETGSASKFIARISEYREEILSINKLMESFAELNGPDYDNFNKQEAALKSVKEQLDKIKPKVEQIMSEKEKILIIFEEDGQVTKEIGKMWDEWWELKEKFMKRHRRWWKAREQLQQFESSLRQVNTWLDTTEQILGSSRYPSGELNIEVAKKHQDLLIKQFQIHNPFYGNVKVLSAKVVSQCSQNDGKLLQQQIETVDQRWRAVIRELAWRRERFQNDGNSLDVLSRWNELIDWLDKSQKILEQTNGKITQVKMAGSILKQIKV